MGIRFSNVRPTETGVSDAMDADVTITRQDGIIRVEVTVVYETWNNSWAPYGNAPGMWIRNPNALAPAEIAALVGAIRAFNFLA